MRGVLQSDAQGKLCEVTFDGVGDFLDAYRSSLSHGGLFVPCDSSAPNLTPMRVTLRLPTLGRAFQLAGTVVVSRPDGFALDLERSASRQWPALSSVGALCDAISREHLAGADAQAQLPPMVLRALPGEEIVLAHGRALSLRGGFASVSEFLRRYYEELGVQILRATAPVTLPVGAELSLRLEAPHHPAPLQVTARVKERRGEEMLLLVVLSAQARMALDGHVRLCEAVWRKVTAEAPPTGAGADPFPEGSDLVEALALLGSGFGKDDALPLPEPPPPPRAPTPPPGEGATWGRRLPAEAVAAPPVVEVVAPPPPAEAPRRAEDERAPDQSGSLEKTSPLALLRELSAAHATGQLIFHRAGERATLRLHKGRVTQVVEDPERPSLRLADLLLYQGVLSPVQKEDVITYARDQGVSFFKALVDLEILPPDRALDALADQLRRRIAAQVEDAQGRYAFYRATPSRTEPALSVAPLAAVYAALRDELARLPARQVEAEQAEHLQAFVVKAPGADVAALELSPGELKLWEKFLSGRMRLKDLSTVSPVGGVRATFATVFALRRLGYVGFERQMGAEHRAAELRKTLEERLRVATGGTPFDVLDLHWSAIDDEVSAAHHRLRDACNWRRQLPEAGEDVQVLSERALRLLDETREALSTAHKRRTWRASHMEHTQVLFASELLVRQGDAALLRHAFRDATDRFTHALELVPHQLEVAERLKDARRKMLGLVE